MGSVGPQGLAWIHYKYFTEVFGEIQLLLLRKHRGCLASEGNAVNLLKAVYQETPSS